MELKIGGAVAPEWVWWSRSSAKHALTWGVDWVAPNKKRTIDHSTALSMVLHVWFCKSCCSSSKAWIESVNLKMDVRSSISIMRLTQIFGWCKGVEPRFVLDQRSSQKRIVDPSPNLQFPTALQKTYSYILYIYIYTIRSEDNWKLFSPKSDVPYPTHRTHPSYVFGSG
jgi:hypothetical protein